LVSRGRAHMLKAEQSEPGDDADWLARALDDAEDAMRLATESGYRWAERDALQLLAAVHDALGAVRQAAGDRAGSDWHHEQAMTAGDDASALASTLTVSKDELRAIKAGALGELHARDLVWTWGV
ncbi:MAG TPA: hypothetical protein VGB66_12195, partial [Longimicrobium sp.]